MSDLPTLTVLTGISPSHRFDEKPSMQIVLYQGYPELDIPYWMLVGPGSLRLNLLNPWIPCQLLHSTPLVGIRQ